MVTEAPDAALEDAVALPGAEGVPGAPVLAPVMAVAEAGTVPVGSGAMANAATAARGMPVGATPPRGGATERGAVSPGRPPPGGLAYQAQRRGYVNEAKAAEAPGTEAAASMADEVEGAAAS